MCAHIGTLVKISSVNFKDIHCICFLLLWEKKLPQSTIKQYGFILSLFLCLRNLSMTNLGPLLWIVMAAISMSIRLLFFLDWGGTSSSGCSCQWQSWGPVFLLRKESRGSPSVPQGHSHCFTMWFSLRLSYSMVAHFFKSSRRTSYSSLLRQNYI